MNCSLYGGVVEGDVHIQEGGLGGRDGPGELYGPAGVETQEEGI